MSSGFALRWPSLDTPSKGRWAALSLGIGLLFGGAPASAESDEERSAAQAQRSTLAESLFTQAESALASGESRRACQLLEASRSLEAALGTSLLLAHCYDVEGRTASAWALFREVASLATKANDVDRARIAGVRGQALEPRLSRIQVVVAKADPASSAQPRVFIDDTELPAASFGLEVPLDPGEHTVTARAPGFRNFETVLVISKDPGVTTLNIPELVAEPKATAPTPSPVANSADQPTEDSSWAPTSSLVAGGLALGAFATSGVFAVLAQRDYDASGKHCRTESLCAQPGLELRERAEDKAFVATVGAAAGVALSAAALTLFLLPESPEATPRDTAMHIGVTDRSLFVGVEAPF